MILIEEKTCSKLPGLTSLFISFPYKKEIINVIKTFSPVNYDKKTLTWEIPLTCLSMFLDSICTYDDIEIRLLEEDNSKDIIHTLSKYKTNPFPYQQEGIQYGLNHDRFLLLDSPGLGKSLQAIYLAQELKQKGEINHCLIICGVNALKYNWKNEIQKHSNLSCRILGERTNKKGRTYIGSVKERIEDLNHPIKEFFIISNVETIRNDDVVKAILKGPNNMDLIIFDEIHTCLKYDTLIQTNLGKLKIGDIVTNQIDCKVLSYDEKNNKNSYQSILNYNKYYTCTVIELTFEDKYQVEHSIKCTVDHKIFTHNRGYIEAQHINEDDEVVVGSENQSSKSILIGRLKSKKCTMDVCPVFDIEVEQNHNYYANNILVHNCKSPTSLQGKNLLKLNKAKYRVGLTGTLLISNPLDCYVPLKWIGAEKGTYTNYRYYYCSYGGPFGNALMGYKNLDILKNQLDKYSLRRTKDILDLPEKTIIHEFLDMSPKQQQFYDNIKQGIIDQVDKVHMSTANLLGMILRLRQATSCPSVLTTENIDCAKLDRAIDLSEQILSDGTSKVVIFANFKQTVEDVKIRLLKFNPVIATGDIKDGDVDAGIKEFQNNPNCKVFIGTWQRAGTGITLTAAQNLIFVDTPWTAAQAQQAEDRIHRIGSKKPVFIHYLWTQGTWDVNVKQIIDDKALLSSYVIDDKVPPMLMDRLRHMLIELQ